MTEDQPADWPGTVDDTRHPFGEVTVGATLCAYCAAENVNAACPISVRTANQRAEIRAGSQHALLAAACHPEKFEILTVYGMRIFPVAVSQIDGTSVCAFHLYALIPRLPRA